MRRGTFDLPQRLVEDFGEVFTQVLSKMNFRLMTCTHIKEENLYRYVGDSPRFESVPDDWKIKDLPRYTLIILMGDDDETLGSVTVTRIDEDGEPMMPGEDGKIRLGKAIVAGALHRDYSSEIGAVLVEMDFKPVLVEYDESIDMYAYIGYSKMFEAYDPKHKHVREAPEYCISYKTDNGRIRLKEVVALKAREAKNDPSATD